MDLETPNCPLVELREERALKRIRGKEEPRATKGRREELIPQCGQKTRKVPLPVLGGMQKVAEESGRAWHRYMGRGLQSKAAGAAELALAGGCGLPREPGWTKAVLCPRQPAQREVGSQRMQHSQRLLPGKQPGDRGRRTVKHRVLVLAR